jgi:hypothetical protein
MGKEVAEAPEAAVFEGAAQWALNVPTITSPAVHNLFLRISYEGDIARFYADGKLINDDFYKGTPFEIGMLRINLLNQNPKLKLQILPMRKDEPIYLPPGSQLTFPPSGQVVRLKEIVAIPEYQAVASIITQGSATVPVFPNTQQLANVGRGSGAGIPDVQRAPQLIEDTDIDTPQ